MSEQIILSFLGTGNYQPTHYHYTHNDESKSCETPFFIVALQNFFPTYQPKVVMTSEAKAKHGDTLSSLLSCESIAIPSGKNETELWQMFENLAEAIPHNAQLIVDVTHGFRSQPMLALAACIYLQTVKQVKVEKILYGAFEATDAAGRTPVFELTPFLELINWSQAAEQLLNYSNALPMRDLLTRIQTKTYLQDDDYKAKRLSTTGNYLGQFTDALALNRPHEVISSASHTLKQLEQVHDDLAALERTKPFALILEEIKRDVAQYQLSNNELFSPAGFEVQAKMLQRYLDSEQYTQALTLAREAIISKLCAAQNMDAQNTNKRKKSEDILNSMAKLMHNGKLMTLEAQTKEVIQLWDSIRNLRNDINHAGMRQNPISAKDAIKNSKEKCQDVQDFLRQDKPEVAVILHNMQEILAG